MVRIIIGLKGSGKTKHLIELANKAVETFPAGQVPERECAGTPVIQNAVNR